MSVRLDGGRLGDMGKVGQVRQSSSPPQHFYFAFDQPPTSLQPASIAPHYIAPHPDPSHHTTPRLVPPLPTAHQAHCAALRNLGASVAAPRERSFHGVCVPLGPSVVLHPSFAPCMSALKCKLTNPLALQLSERSTLLVKGQNIIIDSLVLDGALEITVAESASLHIKSLNVSNEGWQFDELSSAIQSSPQCPEVLRMRGYTLRKRAQRRLAITLPGAFEVVDGELLRVADEPNIGTPATASVPSSPRGGGQMTIALPTTPIGGPLNGSMPPPPSSVWSSAALELAPGSAVTVPLVLREPSVATIEVRPRQAGLWLALLPKEGNPLLPFATVPVGGMPHLEVLVPGSGVYTVQLENRNLLTTVCVSAKVAHMPATAYERTRLQVEIDRGCVEALAVDEIT